MIPRMFGFILCSLFSCSLFFCSVTMAQKPREMHFCETSYLTNERVLASGVSSEEKLYKLIALIDQGNWQHPLFQSSDVYDLLMEAYRKALITEARFLDLMDFIQILSSFSFVDGIPDHIHSMAGESFLRLDAFESHPFLDGFHRALMDDLGADRYFDRKKWHYQQESPAEVTIIALRPEQVRAINSAAAHPAEGKQERGQFLAWLRFFAWHEPELGYLDMMENVLVLPSISFFQQNRSFSPARPSADKVKTEGYFCVMDFDELAWLRSANIHPLALYHPSLQESLESPDGAFLGAMSLRHDLHHVLKLDSIPFEHRQWFLLEDRFQQEFLDFIKRSREQKTTLLEQMPVQFQQVVSLMDSQIEDTGNIVRTLLLASDCQVDEARFPKGDDVRRRFIDQEFLEYSRIAEGYQNLALLEVLIKGWSLGDNTLGDFDGEALFLTRAAYSFYRWHQLQLGEFSGAFYQVVDQVEEQEPIAAALGALYRLWHQTLEHSGFTE